MPRIDPNVMQHHLSVDPKAKGVRQKHRNFCAKKSSVITAEVDHLLIVGFIHEAYYSDWLSTVVLVKKPIASEGCVLTSWT